MVESVVFPFTGYNNNQFLAALNMWYPPIVSCAHVMSSCYDSDIILYPPTSLVCRHDGAGCWNRCYQPKSFSVISKFTAAVLESLSESDSFAQLFFLVFFIDSSESLHFTPLLLRWYLCLVTLCVKCWHVGPILANVLSCWPFGAIVNVQCTTMFTLSVLIFLCTTFTRWIKFHRSI